jgi:hypothetical protein
MSLLRIHKIRHPSALLKIGLTSAMYKGKGKAVPTSNDWWPPHSSEGDFVNHPTEANRIIDHLTRVEASKYYLNGLPEDFNESPELLSSEAQEEAQKAKSAETMVARLTNVKDAHSSRNLSGNKRRELDSYMEAISEALPATPGLQRVLPVPTGRWPLTLPQNTSETQPNTPTHKPMMPQVVHKPPSAGVKKESPLRKSWVLTDLGDSSEENGQAQQS